jgi:hypothetical protein
MTSSTYLNFGFVCCDVTSSRYLQVNLGLADSRKTTNEIYRLMVNNTVKLHIISTCIYLIY